MESGHEQVPTLSYDDYMRERGELDLLAQRETNPEGRIVTREFVGRFSDKEIAENGLDETFVDTVLTRGPDAVITMKAVADPNERSPIAASSPGEVGGYVLFAGENPEGVMIMTKDRSLARKIYDRLVDYLQDEEDGLAMEKAMWDFEDKDSEDYPGVKLIRRLA
ncbi:MAG: hypothetical protein ABIJ46_00115 [bacterium]